MTIELTNKQEKKQKVLEDIDSALSLQLELIFTRKQEVINLTFVFAIHIK